ncbi:MAG TPA: hypothetical protein VFE14_11085 [Micromonosporaceae bacterium]|jgi:hypothetical protein|nr:hypothetical protein [Micromonosporaceae bacterium]
MTTVIVILAVPIVFTALFFGVLMGSRAAFREAIERGRIASTCPACGAAVGHPAGAPAAGPALPRPVAGPAAGNPVLKPAGAPSTKPAGPAAKPAGPAAKTAGRAARSPGLVGPRSSREDQPRHTPSA